MSSKRPVPSILANIGLSVDLHTPLVTFVVSDRPGFLKYRISSHADALAAVETDLDSCGNDNYIETRKKSKGDISYGYIALTDIMGKLAPENLPAGMYWTTSVAPMKAGFSLVVPTNTVSDVCFSPAVEQGILKAIKQNTLLIG